MDAQDGRDVGGRDRGSNYALIQSLGTINISNPILYILCIDVRTNQTLVAGGRSARCYTAVQIANAVAPPAHRQTE